MMSLLLVAGFTIDIGNAYRVKQSLQASADAASAAGAGNLTVGLVLATTLPYIGSDARRRKGRPA
jgi:Flp pilus assembly protein TadG